LKFDISLFEIAFRFFGVGTFKLAKYLNIHLIPIVAAINLGLFYDKFNSIKQRISKAF